MHLRIQLHRCSTQAERSRAASNPPGRPARSVEPSIAPPLDRVPLLRRWRSRHRHIRHHRQHDARPVVRIVPDRLPRNRPGARALVGSPGIQIPREPGWLTTNRPGPDSPRAESGVRRRRRKGTSARAPKLPTSSRRTPAASDRSSLLPARRRKADFLASGVIRARHPGRRRGNSPPTSRAGGTRRRLRRARRRPRTARPDRGHPLRPWRVCRLA